MSETVKKSIKTINFKIRPRTTQKKKENFEIDLPFSLMSEFSSRPVGNLILKNLNEKQKLANTRLQIHLKQIFLNKFNRMIYIKRIFKSELAYRVKMNCTKRLCNFSWTVIFNLKSKNVSMFNNGTICDHFVDSNGKFY